MIRYTSWLQFSLEGSGTPFYQQHNAMNRLVVLSKHIPSNKLAANCYQSLRAYVWAQALSSSKWIDKD